MFTPTPKKPTARIQSARHDVVQVPMRGRMKLEVARKRRGMSARRLAEKSGVAASTIRAIEREKRTAAPHYDTMQKLAEALGMNPHDILWPGDPYALDEE